MDVELVFDGGSKGNPGDSFGSFRLQIDGVPVGPPQRIRFGRGTNNQAEYLSLLAGLRSLLEYLERSGASPSSVHLEIRGDSKLVLSQLQGSWKVKNSVLKELHREAHALLSDFGEVRLVHQPRFMTVRALGH